jgi:myo-inositol-1(or 4)-monophosphatase
VAEEAGAAAAPDELAFAVEVASRAGDLLMDHYERVGQVEHKSPRDIVTEVDRLSEALIIGAIRSVHPGDAILAEESGRHRPAGGEGEAVGGGSPSAGPLAVGGRRIWVVDPLDGTVNYANGIPFFCVSIALVVDGRPVVAVVRDPTRGETFAATADGPATLNGRPVRASTKERLADFVVSLALSGPRVAQRLRAVRRAVRIPRSMGAAALALAYVANGRFDAFIQETGLSTWDIAAAGLIAERGGARVTDLQGGPWFRLEEAPRALGVLAAPPAHHGALLALVAPSAPSPAPTSAPSSSPR